MTISYQYDIAIKKTGISIIRRGFFQISKENINATSKFQLRILYSSVKKRGMETGPKEDDQEGKVYLMRRDQKGFG